MDTRSEYVLKLLHKKTFINQWINGKYKEKPLIIYGDAGIGKTSLANYILKDFIKVEINIDFCKAKQRLQEYLNLSLYKKSITMMFEKVKVKALLIDDLKQIQEHDKNLFKQVLDFSKAKEFSHPIIYIFNSISHKQVQFIYKRAFPINISFTEKQYISIIKEFYINKSTIDYHSLVQKSNYNFHNININLSFYQGKTDTIQQYQKNENELFSFIQKIYNEKDLTTVYRSVISDHNIISLNLLENFIDWVDQKRISYQKMIHIIHSIYLSCCIGDTYNNYIQNYCEWDLIEHMITFTNVIPFSTLSFHTIKMKSMIYNKYISRSIIYTYNAKLLYLNNLNIHILSCFYTLIRDKKYEKAKEVSSYYNINLKLSEKFSRYFMIDKNDLKKVFKK